MNTYITHGTCSRKINFDVDENGILKSLEFINGCYGNGQGVSRLAVNRHIDEIIELTKGIQCRNGTSCPDQLSKALEEYKEKHNL